MRLAECTLALTAALVTASCAPATVQAPNPMPHVFVPSEISIRAIDPSAGTPLHRGTRVTFSVTADYELASVASGTVTLVIQDQRHRNLVSGEQASQLVTRGHGQVTLVTTIVIPRKWADRVVVVSPLLASRYGATYTSAVVEYSVVK